MRRPFTRAPKTTVLPPLEALVLPRGSLVVIRPDGRLTSQQRDSLMARLKEAGAQHGVGFFVLETERWETFVIGATE